MFLRHLFLTAATVSASAMLLAQDAVRVKREPTPPADVVIQYQKASAVLQQKARSKKKGVVPAVPMISGAITATVPHDKPIILPENAIEAIRLQSTWRNDAKPMLDSSGGVVYVYGQGRPNIPCAVGQVSTIALAPGEILETKDAELGDTAHWLFGLHQVLRQGQVQMYVTVKPQYAGLDTTLLLFASHHAYHLRLLSDTQGVDLVSFTYPEEEAQALRQQEAQKKAGEQAQQEALAKQRDIEAGNTDKPITNTNYSVKVGKHARYFEPSLIGDNGAHTLIQFGPAAQHRPLPALQILQPVGPGEANIHFDEKRLLYTVDGLFREAQLVAGEGKHKLIVTIHNNKADRE